VVTVTGLQVGHAKDKQIAEERLGDFFHARGCLVSSVHVHLDPTCSTRTTGQADVRFETAASFTRALGITTDDRKFKPSERPHGWLQLQKQRFLTVVPKPDFHSQQWPGSKLAPRFVPKHDTVPLPRSTRPVDPRLNPLNPVPLPRSTGPVDPKHLTTVPLLRSTQPVDPTPNTLALPRSSRPTTQQLGSKAESKGTDPKTKFNITEEGKPQPMLQAKVVSLLEPKSDPQDSKDPKPNVVPSQPWRPRRETLPCDLQEVAESKKQIIAVVLGENDENLKYLCSLPGCAVAFDRNELTFTVHAKDAPAMRVVKEQVADLLEYAKGRLATRDDTTCGSASDTDSSDDCHDADENGTDLKDEALQEVQKYNSTCDPVWRVPLPNMDSSDDCHDADEHGTDLKDEEIQKHNSTCDPIWRVPLSKHATLEPEEVETDVIAGSDGATGVSADHSEANGVCTVDKVLFRPWTCSGCETVNYEVLSVQCQWCRKSGVTL